MAARWYVDTSALAKLIRRERETPALRRWLRGKAWVISDLQRTELQRAARRAGGSGPRRAEALLAAADIIRLTPDLFDAAGRLEPADLRSLDALHIAAARALADDLAGMVGYDGRLTEAAKTAGIRVAAPGSRRPAATG